MQRNTKEWIQYGSAIALLLSGVVMAFLSFFLNNFDVSDSVLWYVSQTLVYAGSIFGVGIYIQSKWGDVKGYVDKMMNEKKGNSDENH
ncbi:YrzE family protein [[Hallella] seregens]|uniref:YrzE family protein n=1 Tax=Hallella seregens ATCC 51272 TaxID=1336250 RepID=A0ABV5ZLJ5_9BACT|nr:YrzE family protein [Hallella seregens]